MLFVETVLVELMLNAIGTTIELFMMRQEPVIEYISLPTRPLDATDLVARCTKTMFPIE
jgi:hypothetical protein